MKIVPVKSAPAALPAMEVSVPVVASAASKRTELFRGCPSSGQTGKISPAGTASFLSTQKNDSGYVQKIYNRKTGSSCVADSDVDQVGPGCLPVIDD